MNVRSRQVWRGHSRRYYAHASDDHHRRHTSGESFLRPARRVPQRVTRARDKSEYLIFIIEMTSEPTQDKDEEVRRLQGCISDMVSLLALPAMWSGREPADIITTLLDVLLSMLRLDFACVRLSDLAGNTVADEV